MSFSVVWKVAVLLYLALVSGVDLTGILYSVGIPYFKKDEVEENLEKATAGWGGWVGRGEKKRAMENRTH